MAKLSTELFVHLPDNLPYKGLDQKVAVDVDLILQGEGAGFSLTKKGVNRSTIYEMAIQDSMEFGLSSNPTPEQVDQTFQDLAKALNLQSPRCNFVLADQLPAEAKIVHDDEAQGAITEKDQAGNVTIKASETIRISSHVCLTIGIKATVDAKKVLALFARIARVRASGNTEFIELLDRFAEGTASFNRITSIQKLAMALEKAANLGHGKGLTGGALDAEVAKLSGGSVKTAEHVRLLYNRTKHPLRSPEDGKFLNEALQNVHITVKEAKLMAAQAIVNKLTA